MVKQDRTIEDLRNHNLQLELDLTRTKLELLKLQREPARNSSPKMVAAAHSTTPGANPTAKPSLKDLHQVPNVQSELKSLMDSLGEPVLVGLTRMSKIRHASCWNPALLEVNVHCLYLISLVPSP